MKPLISLIIHTASCDNFLQSQGIPSYFNAVTNCLSKQTFKEFEFVFVDTYYEENKDEFAKVQTPFQVKHVPIHPKHRYWYDLGHCYISAAKNTGIIYADGDLLISCDDSEFFPENFLKSYWFHFQRGFLMHALHKRMKSIKTENGLVVSPISGDIYVNDHRWARAKGIVSHREGGNLFAGTSFSLEDALQVNGYNEKMDACKSLEDCEFGSRLSAIGKIFIIDPDGFLFILDHPSYADVQCGWKTSEEPTTDCQLSRFETMNKKVITNLIAVENFGMYQCVTELMDVVANKNPLTDKHFKIIQRETLKYRNFDPLSESNRENFNIWLGTPNFDLRQERKEIRSTDWKW